jgi:geranylgeranyl pyrophosphate synthase
LSTTVQSVFEAAGAEAIVLMERAEARMLALAGEHGAELTEYAQTTIAAGGKRLRPLLVCLASGVPVVRSDRLVQAAVAVELVHAATLVHDDVLDNSSLRRGRPTVFAAGGRLAATATGDLLFSRAFAELAGAGAGSAAAVRVLSHACAELAQGELLQRADAWNLDVTLERYLERCRLKTGVLFRAACELGGLAGLADGRWTDGEGGAIESLGAFGEAIGVAFQLFDDVIDIGGPAEVTGKPRGADLLDGTVTLPLIIARERDPSLAALDLRALSGAGALAGICDRIVATGALGVARERALGMVAAAKRQLPALPERQRAALELVADGVVDRYS